MDKEVSDDKDDSMKDYGKTDNIAELQAQLQELMKKLIELLTMQLAQRTGS